MTKTHCLRGHVLVEGNLYYALMEQITLWQGKFRIVAHENNQLRKRLRALEARVEGLAEKKLELKL